MNGEWDCSSSTCCKECCNDVARAVPELSIRFGAVAKAVLEALLFLPACSNVAKRLQGCVAIAKAVLEALGLLPYCRAAGARQCCCKSSVIQSDGS